MATATAPKIHTRIGHDRALCGVHPARAVGPCIVLPNAEFVATPAASRCGRCARLYKAHGYAIDLPAKKKTAARKAFQRRATAAYYRQQP